MPSTPRPASRNGGCAKRVHPSGLRVNRGAAYLDGRLFRGTGEGDVLAYDAATGKKLWSTQHRRSGQGRKRPVRADRLERAGVHRHRRRRPLRGEGPRSMRSTPAPARCGGKPTPCRPTRRQPGNETMQAQARATWGNADDVPITGGGTWTSYTLDAERGLLYIPVGNPGPDFTQGRPAGENLFTNSILVLDAKTGIYRHHYSLVPADFHDWDLAAAPALVTTRRGQARRGGSAEGRSAPRLRCGHQHEAV